MDCYCNCLLNEEEIKHHKNFDFDAEDYNKDYSTLWYHSVLKNSQELSIRHGKINRYILRRILYKNFKQGLEGIYPAEERKNSDTPYREYTKKEQKKLEKLVPYVLADSLSGYSKMKKIEKIKKNIRDCFTLIF